ncbi:hypothetical protein OURE66S_04477 [Oligella ureolytica]
MNLLIANSIYWFLIVVVSLVPLWALWQISKDKGTTAKLVALSGLLVFWLWFGRVEIIITFSLMVLAYYYKSRMYYSRRCAGPNWPKYVLFQFVCTPYAKSLFIASFWQPVFGAVFVFAKEAPHDHQGQDLELR